MLLHDIPKEVVIRSYSDIFLIRVGDVCNVCGDINEDRWGHHDCATEFLNESELDTYYCECPCYRDVGESIHLFASTESSDLICNPCYGGSCPS